MDDGKYFENDKSVSAPLMNTHDGGSSAKKSNSTMNGVVGTEKDRVRHESFGRKEKHKHGDKDVYDSGEEDSAKVQGTLKSHLSGFTSSAVRRSRSVRQKPRMLAGKLRLKQMHRRRSPERTRENRQATAESNLPSKTD